MSEVTLTQDAAPATRLLLHQVASLTRAVTAQAPLAANTGVFTTRVACTVLDRLGVPACPQPVYVAVYNHAAWQASRNGVPAQEWPSTAHAVHLDEHALTASTRRVWNGHLVVTAPSPDGSLLIDLTADQFDRPIRDLIVGGPVLADLPGPGPWHPDQPVVTARGTEPDAIVVYRPIPAEHPHAAGWRHAPAWTDHHTLLVHYTRRILDRLDRP